MQALAILPAKDRAEALKRETPFGPLRGGLSGEQFIRYERNRSLLIMMLALLGVIVIIVAMTRRTQRVGRDEVRETLQPVQSAYLFRVISNPEEAVVTVDGQWAGETPYENELSAGEHTVTIRKKGYRTATKLVSIPKQNLISVILDAE